MLRCGEAKCAVIPHCLSFPPCALPLVRQPACLQPSRAFWLCSSHLVRLVSAVPRISFVCACVCVCVHAACSARVLCCGEAKCAVVVNLVFPSLRSTTCLAVRSKRACCGPVPKARHIASLASLLVHGFQKAWVKRALQRSKSWPATRDTARQFLFPRSPFLSTPAPPLPRVTRFARVSRLFLIALSITNTPYHSSPTAQ